MMAKKVLDGSFFFENEGDIIDRVAREHDYLINKQSRKKDDADNLLRLNLSELEKEEPKPEEPITDINLTAIAEYYHKCLYNNKEASEFLKNKGLKKLEHHSRFKLGYSNGSLLNIIGKTQKQELIKAGILDEDGSEIFKDCITCPSVDDNNQVVCIHGINIYDDSEIKSIYTNKERRGLFNLKASKVYDEVILTGNILDALSLIEIGINNVISVQDVDGFTGYCLKLLQENRVGTVAVAFTQDISGVDIIIDLLVTEGFKVKIIFPPDKKDWNDALLSGVESQSVQELIEKAEIFQSREAKQDFKVKKDGLNHIFTTTDIKYTLTGVKDIFVSDLKLSVKTEYENDFDIDNLNLCSSSSRGRFSINLSHKFNIEPSRIQKDLLKILVYLEAQRNKLLGTQEDDKIEITEEEKKLGMEFLKSPDIFQQIINDMTTLGYVGEDLNKQLMYLCATSRKLDDPISIMIVSQSSSGKSYLIDTVTKLIPDNETVATTSQSEQALNYMEDLRHKFFIFGEVMHSDVVEHQIREMLSNKELSRLVTCKDEKTGKMITKCIKTPAIVAAVMTTTRNNINVENLNRFFVINTDESIEQTRRIYEVQRNKYSLERYHQKKDIVPDIIKKHKSAQRLLRKIVIVNPFGKDLVFPDVLMRMRRDHDRFIDLIAVVCFLRQYQKEIKKDVDVEYIECDYTDYEIARNIMVYGALSSTLDELPKGLVKFYDDFRELARENARKNNLKTLEIGLSQREIRKKIKWIGSETIKKYLRILVRYEYLQIRDGGNRGQKNVYSLIVDEAIDKIDISMIPTVGQIKKKVEDR